MSGVLGMTDDVSANFGAYTSAQVGSSPEQVDELPSSAVTGRGEWRAPAGVWWATRVPGQEAGEEAASDWGDAGRDGGGRPGDAPGAKPGSQRGLGGRSGNGRGKDVARTTWLLFFNGFLH